MNEPQIGNWIKRGRKWHLVESVVAGDVITRCGRRMRDSLPFQVSDVMPLTRMIGQPQLCKAGCDRDARIVRRDDLSVDDDPAHDFDGPDPFARSEDDGSTHNETVP